MRIVAERPKRRSYACHLAMIWPTAIATCIDYHAWSTSDHPDRCSLQLEGLATFIKDHLGVTLSLHATTSI